MSRKKKVAEGSPPPRPDEQGRPSVLSGVRALINKFEGTIGNEDVKVSVAEYIRLVQLDREVRATEPTDIEVLWIERMEQLYEGAD